MSRDLSPLAGYSSPLWTLIIQVRGLCGLSEESRRTLVCGYVLFKSKHGHTRAVAFHSFFGSLVAKWDNYCARSLLVAAKTGLSSCIKF